MIVVHRSMDGAIEYQNENGDPHRDDGPAIIFDDGSEVWCRNGLEHRIDGPSFINRGRFPDGPTEEWFIDGNEMTAEVEEWIEDNDVEKDWRNWTAADKVFFRLSFL